LIHVVLLYEEQAVAKNICVLRPDADQDVWADPHMINLVMRNLLSNAIKFSRSGGAGNDRISIARTTPSLFFKRRGCRNFKTYWINFFQVT